MLPELRREVEFLTLGLDNLAQYSTAADRVNSSVADYLDMCQPGLLRMLAGLPEAEDDERPVYAYGEMVRDHRYTYLLLGLGITRLCLPPYSLPRIQSILTCADLDDARGFVRELLQLDSKRRVRERLDRRTAELLASSQRS